MYVEDILSTLRADLEPYSKDFQKFDEAWLYILVAVINSYQRGVETMQGIPFDRSRKEVVQ